MITAIALLTLACLLFVSTSLLADLAMRFDRPPLEEMFLSLLGIVSSVLCVASAALGIVRLVSAIGGGA